jgi:HK97 family phage major capsid protein
MDKKKLLALLAKKEARKAELKTKITATEDVKELRSLQTEWNELNDEMAELRSMIDSLPDEEDEGNKGKKKNIKENRSADNDNADDAGDDDDEEFRSDKLNGKNEQRGVAPKGQLNPIGTYTAADAQGEARTKENREAAEKRGKDLKEMRSVTVASTGVVMPAHQATTINPTFNEVSSLIDNVASRTLMGGESFTQPYVAGYGTGDYKAEGLDYADAEPTFGSAAINKAKVTAYAEDSEELIKLPAADYDGEVQKSIRIGSRKKISREILIGTGAANHLAGIFSTAATAIDADTDIDFAEIDETTLDEIIYSFGGDEDVEGAAVLILNKKDLKAFAQLRTSDGKKLHTIVSKGNYGTIDGIPYIINSACKAISDATTGSGDYCMAYGPLTNYMLVIFSDLDIQRSTDFKFKQGMICHKASIFVGGNVVSKNGFLRIKKT